MKIIIEGDEMKVKHLYKGLVNKCKRKKLTITLESDSKKKANPVKKIKVETK